MKLNVHQAFKEWALGTAGAFNAEDAYCAGYEMALRVKDEERRGEDHPIVKNLMAIARLTFPLG